MYSSPRSKAEAVVRTLCSSGYTAYFAGGCVRDRLMDIDPKDYDIATNATPAEIAKLFPSHRMVGAHFGVVLVHHQGTDIEVATFREDGSYGDGRRPDDVCFSTPEKDAQRRDFTINGLFENPLDNQVIDYVHGLQDIENRCIRAIGNPIRRFEEDYLRLLRAIRFAARFDFEIDPDTWAALCDHAAKVSKISVERVREELRQILTNPSRLRGFDLLIESGIMGHLIPEILTLKGCEQPPEFHPEGDVFTHTRIMLGMLDDDASEALVWAVLLHDIAKPATRTVDDDGRIRFNGHDKAGAEMAEEILRRLKSPNALIHDVVEMVSQHMNFMNVTKMKRSTLRRFMGRSTFDDEIELHRVDCQSSNGITENYEFVLDKQREFAEEPVIPPALVTGNDLIKRGWKPGPEIGKLLTKLQNMQLEGTLADRESALEYIDSLNPPAKNTPG